MRAVRVGGFDSENFCDIVEDVELGWRLERAGYRILYRSELVAEHAGRSALEEAAEAAIEALRLLPGGDSVRRPVLERVAALALAR